MPPALTDRQQEYLTFIRDYIQENQCTPRLDEIAKHLHVTSPTAHKTLQTLQESGKLYFDRDPVTGFYIRVPERVGTAAPIYEVNLIGKVNRYGEIMEFTDKFGHFPTTVSDAAPENLFAVELWQHIPNASMRAGDVLIFDQGQVPQPGQLGIMPWGKGGLLVRLYDLHIDADLPFFSLLEDELSEWQELVKEIDGYLFWWPLAHADATDDYFAKAAVELEFPWRPIPFDHIVATAVRLDRPLTI